MLLQSILLLLKKTQVINWITLGAAVLNIVLNIILIPKIAMFGAALCAVAVLQDSFYLFILGSVLIGVFSGFANYYRFTAADSVDTEHKSRAISYVLAGGVLAAIIGPNLANLTRDMISGAAFAGSYGSIILLYVLSFISLSLMVNS